MQLIFCKDYANRKQNHQACLNVMLRCSQSYCKDNINFSKPRLFISIFYEIVAYICKKPYICKQ